MADNTTKTATLQAILDAGASGVSVDGESVTYDLAAIRKEIRELKQADPNFRNRRPRAASINPGGLLVLMNTAGTLNSKAKDHAADALHRLGYDATADKGRRQSLTSRLLAEDKHLNVSARTRESVGNPATVYGL